MLRLAEIRHDGLFSAEPVSAVLREIPKNRPIDVDSRWNRQVGKSRKFPIERRIGETVLHRVQKNLRSSINALPQRKTIDWE